MRFVSQSARLKQLSYVDFPGDGSGDQSRAAFLKQVDGEKPYSSSSYGGYWTGFVPNSLSTLGQLTPVAGSLRRLRVAETLNIHESPQSNR